MIPFAGRPDNGATSATPYKSGPSAGSSGAPSLAELRNPTLVNSQISQQTNVTTSLPLMIRPWQDGYEKQFNQGSILFVHKEEGAQRMSTVADLPLMNYIMEKAHSTTPPQQPMYANTKKVDTLQGRGGWNLFGILRNDMLADSSLQKLLNIDVFGRAMIANIFGQLKRGDLVGLALMEIDCGKKNFGFVEPNGQKNPANLIGTSKVLQFVPTVNHKTIANFLTQGEEEKFEAHYPLGIVSHAVGRVPLTGQIITALRNQSMYTLLPRIEILMI